MISLKMRQIHL